jgi:histidine ammonia-lyase
MKILENTEYIIAIESLCATQAIEYREPERLGKGTRVAYVTVRNKVPMIEEDRVLGKDIEKSKNDK